jgi:hypothetical protein
MTKRAAVGAAMAIAALLASCSAASPTATRAQSAPTTAGAPSASSSSAPPSRPTVPLAPADKQVAGQVGETLSLDGSTIVVTDVGFSTCGGTASPGNTVAMVSATISDLSNDAMVDYGAFSWTLIDSTGRTYQPDLVESTCPVADHTSDPGLKPGTTVTPVIYFDVPGTVAGLRVVWEPSQGETATVTVPN